MATDIAARGVDIASISHVINYDMPDTADAYTHRVGRTGRAARTGEAYTLVTQQDQPAVRSFERTIGVELVCRELAGFDYNAKAPGKGASAHCVNAPSRKPAPPSSGRGRGVHGFRRKAALHTQ